MGNIRISTISWLLCWGLSIAPSKAQDIFNDKSLLEVALITDLPELHADRDTKVEYHTATLRYRTGNDTVVVPTQIRARGHFRRQPRVCDMPPLKFKTKKKDRQGTLFEPHDKLKLVSHCRGDLYVKREYLLYEVYDILAKHTLRVRPAQITYLDSHDSLPTETHFAFFLEHQDVADGRLRANQIEGERLKPAQIDQDNLVLISLFNYLIGNTDWDVTLEKNVRIFWLLGDDTPILVPYDFDWSGAVNAAYTGLGEEFDRRRLNGPYANEATYLRWLNHILIRERAIMDLYKSFPHFDNGKERRESMEYLKESFQLMKSPAFREEVRAMCEGWR